MEREKTNFIERLGLSNTPQQLEKEYDIVREIAQGATAKVFFALRKSDQKKVALKVFHPGLLSNRDFVRRIEGELRAVQKITHPGIVKLVAQHLDSAQPAIAFEFIEGQELSDYQSRLPYVLPEISALLMVMILEALEHAHSLSIIHRDLKPSNVLVGNDGKIFITDFGLAKTLDSATQTMSGTLVGSPDYMSPEQALGEKVGPASDVFSAASLFYFLVSGTRPFFRDSPLSTLAAVIKGNYEPVQSRNPKVSLELAQIIHKGLSKTESQRYANASEFLHAIQKYLKSVGLFSESLSFGYWFDYPSARTTEFLKIIFDAQVDRSHQALKVGDFQTAFELISHVSLIAPQSEKLKELMSEYENSLVQKDRRKKRRLFLTIASPLIILFLATSLGVGFWIKTKMKIPPLITARVIERPQKVVLPVIQVPTVGQVSISVPEDVEVYWADRKLESKSRFTEKPGRYKVRLIKKGFKAIEQEVTVKTNEPTKIHVSP